MNEREEGFKLDYYLELALKHRWLIIIPFCLAMMVGIYLAITLPRIYSSSTLILVRPQRVPESFVQSIVTADIESRISTISQQILSRTNLEKIINQFNLFSEPGQENMFMEDKIADLRRRIKIKIEEIMSSKQKYAGAFSISFSGSHPELVMRVANGLSTYFIDENLKVREAQAIGTSDFLDDELVAMRKRLESLEQQLKDYRTTYMGELPEQLETNLRILDRLQMQLNQKEESLSDGRASVIVLENQIEANRKFLSDSSAASASNGESMNLSELRARLESLRSTYTDQHPDVVRLKAKIEDLEAKYKSGELQKSEAFETPVSNDPTLTMVSKTLDEQMRQRVETKMETRNLVAEIAKIKSQIRHYQQRVERTPEREQELMSLQRDYDNMQESYRSLLNRKLEAEIAVNMEKKQKGEQFSILDPARLPERPVSPNMPRLFLMVLVAGLGLGGGLIFLLDFFDTSLRKPANFEPTLGIPVLATVPRIYQPRDIRRKRINHAMTIFSLLVAVCLLAGFAVLVFNGVESTLQIVRPYIAFIKI